MKNSITSERRTKLVGFKGDRQNSANKAELACSLFATMQGHDSESTIDFEPGMNGLPIRPKHSSAKAIIGLLGTSPPSYILDKPTLYRYLNDAGFSAEDIHAGIQNCVDLGWLEKSGEGWEKTAAGLFEIQRVAEQQRLIDAAELAQGEVWFDSFGLKLRSKRGAAPLGWLTFIFLFAIMFILPVWALIRLL